MIPDHKLRTLFITIACASLLAFCVSAPPAQAQDKAIGADAPQWMFDLNAAYPDADFLAVIGEGDSRREAELDAAGALSKIFVSKIDVETTAVMRYRELEKNGSGDAVTERKLDKRVTVASAQDLINLQFSDLYTDKLGLVHIVGYLNRKETAKIYRQKIAQNGERVTGFLKNLDEAEDTIHRYAYIDAAVLFAKANELLLEQLTIIYPIARKTVELPYDMNQLAKRYADVAGKMIFTVKVQNDSDAKIAKITGYLLSQKGFTVSKGAAALSLDGEVLIEDTKMNNKYANVRWTLDLEMKDEKDHVIITYHKNQRESAVSRPEAVARSYREMEKQIKDEFLGQFEQYLNGLILK
jgi:hypothetical protein